VQTLREKAIEHGVYLAINLRIPANKECFRADPKRVKQILLNLLSNGIKFTPENGQVILRVWLEGNTAVFEVEDTGIGIPEHQRHLLFQKFQQLDTSYNREYEGVGLGLALTKQLIELHGGRIEVESTVGVGSIFTVWLPCQPIASMGEGKLPIPDIAPARVAVIADREESATLICDILTAADYQVVWLMEGSAAIKQIEILQSQIVIVDMQLSGINGYEVMGLLRRSKTTQGIKILALISQETPENLTNILAEGADDYLTKPIIPEQLLEAIAALIIADVPAACAIK
jgi:two-component system, sensor histidine kinase and response regulator